MGKVMKLYIKYFASVRDMMGKDSEVIDIDTREFVVDWNSVNR